MSPEALTWLRAEEPHNDCEDCWYSCATLTCDERRRSTECDCGADTVTKHKREILAALGRTDQ